MLFEQVRQNAKGVLGETLVPTRDATGKPIMTGMEAIRGTQKDCECSRNDRRRHVAAEELP